MCVRSELTFMLPFEITYPKLQMNIQLQNKYIHQQLCQLLTERRFEELWYLASIHHELGSHCLFCDQAIADPAALQWHLLEVHYSAVQWVRFVIPMLVEKLKHSFDGKAHCQGCGMIFQLPPELHATKICMNDAILVHI